MAAVVMSQDQGQQEDLKTPSYQIQEKPPSSKYRGVCWNKKNKRWQAAINIQGTYYYLGSYVEEDAAAKAFDKAAVENRGDRARVNFQQSKQLYQHNPKALVGTGKEPSNKRRKQTHNTADIVKKELPEIPDLSALPPSTPHEEVSLNTCNPMLLKTPPVYADVQTSSYALQSQGLQDTYQVHEQLAANYKLPSPAEPNQRLSPMQHVPKMRPAHVPEPVPQRMSGIVLPNRSSGFSIPIHVIMNTQGGGGGQQLVLAPSDINGVSANAGASVLTQQLQQQQPQQQQQKIDVSAGLQPLSAGPLLALASGSIGQGNSLNANDSDLFKLFQNSSLLSLDQNGSSFGAAIQGANRTSLEQALRALPEQPIGTPAALQQQGQQRLVTTQPLKLEELWGKVQHPSQAQQQPEVCGSQIPSGLPVRQIQEPCVQQQQMGAGGGGGAMQQRAPIGETQIMDVLTKYEESLQLGGVVFMDRGTGVYGFCITDSGNRCQQVLKYESQADAHSACMNQLQRLASTKASLQGIGLGQVPVPQQRTTPTLPINSAMPQAQPSPLQQPQPGVNPGQSSLAEIYEAVLPPPSSQSQLDRSGPQLSDMDSRLSGLGLLSELVQSNSGANILGIKGSLKDGNLLFKQLLDSSLSLKPSGDALGKDTRWNMGVLGGEDGLLAGAPRTSEAGKQEQSKLDHIDNSSTGQGVPGWGT